MTYVLAIVLGAVAGILSGLFGVGGGILFVPTLTALGLTQLHAEASSLLAIIPTVLVGVWRQQRYGNVRWRPAAIIGVASIGAAVGGAKVAESVNEATLRKLFAVLLLCVAAQIAWRAPQEPVMHARALASCSALALALAAGAGARGVSPERPAGSTARAWAVSVIVPGEPAAGTRVLAAPAGAIAFDGAYAYPR